MDSIDSLSTDIYFDGSKEVNKVQKGGNIDTERLNDQLKSVLDHIKKYELKFTSEFSDSRSYSEESSDHSDISNFTDSYSDYSNSKTYTKTYSLKNLKVNIKKIKLIHIVIRVILVILIKLKLILMKNTHILIIKKK